MWTWYKIDEGSSLRCLETWYVWLALGNQRSSFSLAVILKLGSLWYRGLGGCNGGGGNDPTVIPQKSQWHMHLLLHSLKLCGGKKKKSKMFFLSE